jgi:hypothetical protein
VDIDLNDLQAGHPLDRGDHVAAHRPGQIGDGDPVFDQDFQVDRGLGLSDLDRHTL